MTRLFVTLGGLLAFLAVAAGAFGAHGLRDHLAPERLAAFETAARYQMVHALAILFVGSAADRWAGTAWTTAGWLFVAGCVVFSGSLYLLAFTGARGWGAVTPVGGVCFLGGWACVVIAALRAA